MTFQLEPYCGNAPTPEALMADWNLDRVLLSGIVLVAVWTWPLARAERRLGQWALFIGLCAVAFVSPLCGLSSALFSARAFHHIVLISFAAPLGWRFFFRSAGTLDRLPPTAAFVLHTLVIWLWHLPLPYTWALSGSFAYWAMEIPLLLSSLWLWREILDPKRAAGGALAVCGATILQMTILGAFLTLAPHPLFSPHFLTTDIYGLSPLEDQQLAGLLMWVPASLPYVAAFLLRIGQTITRSSREAAG
ncbi:cytochrome c oxidase assembly protein [Agrobacterium vitis]|uniref:cytochrome c oxidase assembly protein n=1 Tax=Agrobacterium vitis TaxID=373 RepID=UPI0012E7290A|nr:cytochrome c oxidase assembly protein [Agrobacterium vitis]MVA37728.1 cytochrome c oxidase assembly protein [Agrobacterium vitis]MVA82281.1 cytochrome c oxidase assembly protein [Agrobacterium vitis]